MAEKAIASCKNLPMLEKSLGVRIEQPLVTLKVIGPS